MSVDAYTMYCQNEECEADVEVEILSVSLGDEGRWADRWEDSYPATPSEVEYDTAPVCTKCGMVQVIDKELDEKISEYAIEYVEQSFYDDGV
jgi:hypothetical protein